MALVTDNGGDPVERSMRMINHWATWFCMQYTRWIIQRLYSCISVRSCSEMSREARRRWKSSAAAKPCLPNLKHSELGRAPSGSVQRKLDHLSYVASKSDSETGDLSLPNLMDCLKVENINALPSVADGRAKTSDKRCFYQEGQERKDETSPCSLGRLNGSVDNICNVNWFW